MIVYIDFHKYNYNLVDSKHINDYQERDKKAYRDVLKKWLEENLEKIIERKWEIEEIQYLSEVSDFIKLLREAETLYELGFYTSCVALIGVSAEDFSKYLSFKLGRSGEESLSQFNRLQAQRNDGVIDSAVYSLLDDIRKVRNDCLHYNQDFKAKGESTLRQEAIQSLNNLKTVLKHMLGISNVNDLGQIITELSKLTSEDAKNFDEVTLKIRNALSHLLNLPSAYHPTDKLIVKDDYFLVGEIDFEWNEATLKSILKYPNQFVIVELDEQVKKNIQKLEIKEGQTVYAVICSFLNELGMSAEWNIWYLQRVDNSPDILHDAFHGGKEI